MIPRYAGVNSPHIGHVSTPPRGGRRGHSTFPAGVAMFAGAGVVDGRGRKWFFRHATSAWESERDHEFFPSRTTDWPPHRGKAHSVIA
jgi:hypothetical protein